MRGSYWISWTKHQVIVFNVTWVFIILLLILMSATCNSLFLGYFSMWQGWYIFFYYYLIFKYLKKKKKNWYPKLKAQKLVFRYPHIECLPNDSIMCIRILDFFLNILFLFFVNLFYGPLVWYRLVVCLWQLSRRVREMRETRTAPVAQKFERKASVGVRKGLSSLQSFPRGMECVDPLKLG